GWATWSNGYTGDVYACIATETTPCTTLTITLPANTVAFYFYVEPNNFATFTVTATLADGTTSGPVSVAGNSGATYFGFYTTSLSSPITSVMITVDAGAGGFAVGEFGIDTSGSAAAATTSSVSSRLRRRAYGAHAGA